MSEGAAIAVAIPTFRRPEDLKRLLAALEQLETAHKVSVVVADNDAAGHQGYDLCRALAPSYRFPLDPVIAPERGIAQVRNALVAQALRYPEIGYVAMLDDDEWPSPHWLDELVRTQRQTGAEIVEGSIEFEGGGFDTGFDGVSSMRRPTGPTPMLEGAGNLLITRACLDNLTAPWFDPAFALTGGEDRDFFERVKAAGGQFAWSDEALAYTKVPETRQNLSWILRRAYAIGNTEMRIFLKYRPSFAARLKEVLKIAAALVLMPVLSVLLAGRPRQAADALRRFCRNWGKAMALAGAVYQPYAVAHDG